VKYLMTAFSLATAKAIRIQNQLRKALITAIDVLEADAVPATGTAVASFGTTSRGLKDAPAPPCARLPIPATDH
jgi:hypothetical protein